MNLSESQSQYVVTLEPGAAAVFADGMDRPLLAQMRPGEDREDAGPATRMPPVVSERRRSRACGERCREGEPCTLAAMRHAERLLGAYPQLTFWTEVSCAAHGVGYPAPRFADTHAVRELCTRAAAEPRLVQCAIMHAVENAIASRYEGLMAFFDPEALGEHLRELATQLLFEAGEDPICAEDHGRWRVGAQRFADVEHRLRELAGDGLPAVPHEEVLRRARDRGLDLEGGSPGAQLDHLSSLPWRHLKGDRQRALLVGELTPPRVVSSAAAIVGPGEASEQLADASARTLAWANAEQPKRLLPQLVRPAAVAKEDALEH